MRYQRITLRACIVDGPPVEVDGVAINDLWGVQASPCRYVGQEESPGCILYEIQHRPTGRCLGPLFVRLRDAVAAAEWLHAYLSDDLLDWAQSDRAADREACPDKILMTSLVTKLPYFGTIVPGPFLAEEVHA